MLTTQTLDKQHGIEALQRAIELCQEALTMRKGAFKVKEAPRTVSDRDDLLLQSQMQDLEAKAKEVRGGWAGAWSMLPASHLGWGRRTCCLRAEPHCGGGQLSLLSCWVLQG